MCVCVYVGSCCYSLSGSIYKTVYPLFVPPPPQHYLNRRKTVSFLSIHLFIYKHIHLYVKLLFYMRTYKQKPNTTRPILLKKYKKIKILINEYKKCLKNVLFYMISLSLNYMTMCKINNTRVK